MTMPRNLVLVRHGESEGNVATHRSKAGDDSLFTPEFLARHSSSFRLTDLGRQQATAAGVWIKENLNGGRFDRYYVSTYDRALETASLLNLPDAAWRIRDYLRERDWGELDVRTHAERTELYARNMKRRKVESLYWNPPNGESLANLGANRVHRHFDTLHRECSDKDVIMVLHGEWMWSARITLESMLPQRFDELDASTNPHDHMHNCQILHYTRVDPRTGREALNYQWMRSICPTDPSLSKNEWEPIVRRTYSNADLLAMVEQQPRMIAG